MTAHVSIPELGLDGVALDPPLFDPAAFRLSDDEAALAAKARAMGQAIFAARAAIHDREANFPTENYRDLHKAGFLGICIPKRRGRARRRLPDLFDLRRRDRPLLRRDGADLEHACLLDACGRARSPTTSTWTPATRAEHERRRALHYRRIVEDGAIYAQPFSEGGAAAAGGAAFETAGRARSRAAGVVNGKKIFASLAGHADYYGVLATEHAGDGAPRAATRSISPFRRKAEGVSVVGDWDPLGMRGTVSRTLLFRDVFVAEEQALMPRGVYFQAATRWPHMFLTLSPTYIGLAQAAYDFTVKYLRGEAPGTPPVKRRMYPTKQIAVAEMRIRLEAAKALWFQAVTEAQAEPDEGAGAARLRGPVLHHGERKRHRAPGDPHLRRAVDAEVAAARAHLPRQPLRLADAALDRRALPRPHRARGALRAGRDGRVSAAEPWTSPISSSGTRRSRRTSRPLRFEGRHADLCGAGGADRGGGAGAEEPSSGSVAATASRCSP